MSAATLERFRNQEVMAVPGKVAPQPRIGLLSVLGLNAVASVTMGTAASSAGFGVWAILLSVTFGGAVLTLLALAILYAADIL